MSKEKDFVQLTFYKQRHFNASPKVSMLQRPTNITDTKRPEKKFLDSHLDFRKKNGRSRWILHFIPGPSSKEVNHNKTR